MVRLQMLYGSLLTALAVVALRPISRAHAGGEGRKPPVATPRPSRLGRPPRRVPCGDDPMLWKGLFIPRVPVFHRPLGLSIALVLLGLLAWGTIDFALPAFRGPGRRPRLRRAARSPADVRNGG